jgi:hypothetical protein
MIVPEEMILWVHLSIRANQLKQFNFFVDKPV